MLLPPDELSDITTHISNITLDIRYATKNNFTGEQLYEHQIAWLRHKPLKALILAAEEFASAGYSLVIFDAFRPVSVQKKLRLTCDNEDYVVEISNHCRGITVDVSLADINGVYLDMGTDYDDFSEKSHPGSKTATAEQKLNRQFLAKTMEKVGFCQHPREWWHFDFEPTASWKIVYDESNTFKPA